MKTILMILIATQFTACASYRTRQLSQCEGEDAIAYYGSQKACRYAINKEVDQGNAKAWRDLGNSFQPEEKTKITCTQFLNQTTCR